MVCLTDARIENTELLLEPFAKGELIVRPESLRRISKFLSTEGAPIRESAFGPRTGLDSSSAFTVVEDLGSSELIWVDCYAKARAFLFTSDEFFSEVFYDLVHFIVPIAANRKFAFSTHLARGAIFFTAPESSNAVTTMAIDLAHELGHQALMVFQSTDPLLASPLDQPVWSAIRKTTRPAIQSMQAAAAIAFMLVFIRGALKRADIDEGQRTHLNNSRAALREGLDATLKALDENCTFTPLGRSLVGEFHEMLDDSSHPSPLAEQAKGIRKALSKFWTRNAD
jgi:hypothetical protein